MKSKKINVGIDLKLGFIANENDETSFLEFVIEIYDCIITEFNLIGQNETIQSLENKRVEALTSSLLSLVRKDIILYEEIKQIEESIKAINESNVVKIIPSKESKNFLFRIKEIINNEKIDEHLKIRNLFMMKVQYNPNVAEKERAEIFLLIERVMLLSSVIGMDQSGQKIIQNVKDELFLKLREENLKVLLKKASEISNEKSKKGFKKGKI